MNATRLDELTTALLDGTLTPAASSELETRLADPTQLAPYLALVRLEAELRGLYVPDDLAATTLARIEADRADRTATAVLSQLTQQPVPTWANRRAASRPWPLFFVGAVCAALLLVVVWFVWPTKPTPHWPDAADIARITTRIGAIEIVQPDGRVVDMNPAQLASGQTLRTIGEDSSALVEFPDQTRMELHPDSAVQFTRDEAGTRKLVLLHGQLTAHVADVADAKTHFGTASTAVVARRGTFGLWASGTGSARIEMQDGAGQVQLGGASPIALLHGEAAFVRDETTPIAIEAPRPLQAAPRHRVDFAALNVFFADRELWAATGKQWVRSPLTITNPKLELRWQTFTPAVKNDGHVALFSHDGKTLVTCRVDDRDDRVVIRQIPEGTEKAVLPVRVSEPRFACVAPDGSWVATSTTKPPRIRMWEMTGRERFTLEPERGAFCMAATPDGRYLVADATDLSRSTNNEVTFYDATTGRKAFALPTARRQITALNFTADSRFMAAGSNGAVQVWDIAQRERQRLLVGFERVVTCVAFSPNGSRLAAGMQDGQVWLWSVAEGKRLQVFDTGSRGVRSLAFSPDGRQLLTATNKAPVALWDVSGDD